MVFSICYECKGKIEINEGICSHCGNKLNADMYPQDWVYKINGVEYNLKPFEQDLFCSDEEWGKENRIKVFSMVRKLTNCAKAGSLCIAIRYGRYDRTQEFIGQTEEEMEQMDKMYKVYRPKCPTCGSYNVHEIGWGERTLSVNLFGLGSKKINKSFECNNCGYTW